MANYLSFKVTNATPHLNGTRLVGLNNVVTAVATGTAAVKIHCGLSDDITIATSADGAIVVVDAINTAISSNPGGNVVSVILPAGVTITSFTLA
jgi:hypothetical protein